MCAPLSGAPQNCFQSGPAHAKAGPASETETWLKLRDRDFAIKAETWTFETETRELTFL